MDTQTSGRPKPKTIEDTFGDLVNDIGFEIMMRRPEKAREYISQARGMLGQIIDKDLLERYSFFINKYETTFGKLE